MPKLCFIFPVVALLAWQGFGGEPGRYRADRVILMPKRGAAPEALRQLHSGKNRCVLKEFPGMGGMQVIQLGPGEEVGEAVLRYRASGTVEFAEPDYKLHALATPDDPEFRRGTQWPLYNTGQFGGRQGADIGAVAAWDTIRSASNVVVAVVDSGIRYTHEDLAANIWTNPNEIAGNGIDDDRNGYIDDVHGIDAIVNGGDPMDDVGHGTHVAGIIGAVGNNGIGIAGVAWSVRLMGLRFLSKAQEGGDTSDAIQCIDYARRMGAQVINASWGGPDYSAALYNAINSARAAGIVFVAPAGNEAVDIDQAPIYPACYNLDNIVVVGGTTRSDALDVSYSSYGANSVDLFAPGTGVYSTWHTWDGAYTSSSGTSMAVPHVAGVVALMRARFADYSTAQIVARLLATVDTLPGLTGKCRSGGRLNMARALGPNPAAGFSASVLSGEPPLAVGFTNTSFGEVASWRWNFGDGSGPETNASPAHVFEFAGTFRVRLEITGKNGQTNAFEQAIEVAPNYVAGAAPFEWVDPAGMAVFPLGDNGVSTEQPLPFPFRFYGETYTSIYIGANGALSFSSAGLAASDNTTLPVANAPNALICPYWDNLNPAAGGSIHAGVTGEAPERRYVVSWVGVPRNSSAVNLTFQAILEEGTQEIVFQYLETQPTASRGGGKRATVGLENAKGTIAALYTYNGSPEILQNGSAIRFAQRPFRFLAVNHSGALTFTAVRGQASGGTTALQLHNLGNQEIRWQAGSAAPWLSIPAGAGTLAADATHDLEIALSAAAADLPAGRFESSVEIANLDDGRGNRSIPVVLEIAEPVARLEAEWSTTNLFTGGLGGPFLPATGEILLRNAGTLPLRWSGSASAPWLALAPADGELEIGESAGVQVRLTEEAGTLASGRHAATIRFEIGEGAPVEMAAGVQVNSMLVPHAASVLDGVFRGAFAIPIEGTYFIEASEDLANWQILEIEPAAAGGTVSFQDAVGGQGRRFYRLLVTPPQ